MIVHERAAWQPVSCKRFGVQRNPRTLIYTDINRPVWYIESLSNSDIMVIQTTINNRSTLLISLYLPGDRFTKMNTDSFDGKPIHIQKAETTIYTDGSKTDHGVGAGFVIYHKNRKIPGDTLETLHFFHKLFRGTRMCLRYMTFWRKTCI